MHEVRDRGRDLIGAVLLQQLSAFDGNFALIGPVADDLAYTTDHDRTRIADSVVTRYGRSVTLEP